MTKKFPSLKAASEDKDTPAEKRSVSKSVPTFDVDPRKIKVRPGFNMRQIDRAHVATIRESMLGGAQFQPMWIVIEDGEICMLDGEHRLTAYLGLPTIPHRVKCLEFKPNGFPPTMQQQILFMMGCAKGKTALPLQVGTQYALLVNTYGMSYANIAKDDGVSVQHVKDMIRLTQQDHEVTKMIADGTVTATTALKVIKKEGKVEGTKILKDAAAVSKKVTQKTIDRVAPKGITPAVKAVAAKSMVTEVANRSDIVKAHLSAMLESPSITGPNREHVKAVLAMCMGIPPAAPAAPVESAADFLRRYANHANQSVTNAAGIMGIVLSGKLDKLPPAGTPESEQYGHRRWLELMASDSHQRKPLRQGAHWFLAVLDANRSHREVAPPPSVMTLEDAIQAEIDSGCAVLATDMCPEAEGLIYYLMSKGE